MQNTTADYKLEINKPSRSFECKITIGDNIYNNEDLVNLTLEYTQPQEGFVIGNTISQSLDLTLLNRGDIIYSTSQIKVELGLKIGSTIEYILMGIFNIDDIEKTDYTTKFTAYDNMIKFETAYFSELGDNPKLQQVVNELEKKTGVQFIGNLPAYTVSKLEGFSCREVLSYVASICGGNAVITRDGKFTIKSLSEVEKAIDGNNYFDYTREEVKYKIGQISCQVDENNILSKGLTGTDSMELGFENPWVTETILTEIYNKLNGLSYLGYSMKWQGDISLDPYDIITVTDVKNVTRKIPILSQKLSYAGGLTSEIGAKGETKNKNSFSSSGSTTNKVNRAIIEQAIIKEALIEKANIKDLEAVSIRTQTLEAKTAKIEEAIIDVAHIKDLNAINANIQNLIAADATINNALIGKADITELNAVKGTINVLESDTANIKNLLAGNITGESGQLIHLTASNVVIADAVIKDLIAANISVEDLKASTISTNKFNICSDDGGISIAGATMQFKDKKNKVRIQMGQDSQGSFNFILRGADGTTVLIDHTGIKENAIADNLIKENMVAADAIGEKQINYSSLITGLNKDTNTSLIKASKVAIDLTGQSLEVSFNSLKSNVDNMEIGGRNYCTKTNLSNMDNADKSYPIIIDKNHVDCPNGFYAVGNKNAIGTIRLPNVINENGYWTVSFDIRGSQSVSVGLNIDICDLGTTTIKTTSDNTWKRVSITVNVTNYSEDVYNFVDFFNLAWAHFYIRKIKVEKGTKATDWTAAPEDTDSKIESNTTDITVAQGKIDGLIAENTIIKGDITTISDKYTSIKATVDEINTTVASHTSSIGTINTNISGLSGKVTTVENNYASLSQNLEGFKTTVGNTYSTKNELSTIDGKVISLGSRVNTAESAITQLNNKIALKVEQSDIEQAINNVDIGVTNLFKNSNFKETMKYPSETSKHPNLYPLKWSGYNGGINNPTESYHAHVDNTTFGYNVVEFNESDGTRHWKGTNQDLTGTLTQFDEYMFSADIYSTLKGAKVFGGFYYYKIGATNQSFWSGHFTIKDEIPVNKWARCSAKVPLYDNVDFSKTITFYIYGYGFDSNSICYIKNVKLEKGNKATDWTPASEDTDSAINAVDSKVETTKNKVAEIVTNLDSITQRVSSTESTVVSHTTQLGTVDSRIEGAKNSAISTASSDATTKANNAQNNAVNSAKGYTDGQINTVNQTISNKVAEIKTTTDAISSKVSKTEQIASSSLQGKMLYTDPTFKQGTNSINSYNNGGNGTVTISRVAKSSDCPTSSTHMLQITTNGTASPGHGGFYFGNFTRANAIFISKLIAKVPVGYTIRFASNSYGNGGSADWLSSNNGVGTGKWEEYIFKVKCGEGGSFNTTNFFYLIGGNAPVTWYLAFATVFDITETSNLESRMNTAEQKITPTAIINTVSEVINNGTGSINTVSTVLDKTGLTINNGAIRIRNNAGTNVLEADVNGNLILTGTIKSQSGEQYVSLNSGGITFQDAHRNEQILRMATSAYASNRDINGMTIAMAQYCDYVRFSHLKKADLNGGWDSSVSQYNFLDLWSGDQTIGSTKFKKGINIFAPTYFRGGSNILIDQGSNYWGEIGNAAWNSISGQIGVFGDNGVLLGFKSNDTKSIRLALTESAHPGTGDQIRSYGHWNFSGHILHSCSVNATSLSVSGSKNCLQKTESYGERLINAYETAEYYFGDLGFGKINEDGECLISIDDILQECINLDCKYHVFTQVYKGSIYQIDRQRNYFIVYGEPNTEFSWQYIAKRIGYENNRLDTPDIENQCESGVELFSDEDFNIKTSENTLMDIITYSLEDLLMEG